MTARVSTAPSAAASSVLMDSRKERPRLHLQALLRGPWAELEDIGYVKFEAVEPEPCGNLTWVPRYTNEGLQAVEFFLR